MGEAVRHLKYTDRILMLHQLVSNCASDQLSLVASLGDYTLSVVDYVHILPHKGGDL